MSPNENVCALTYFYFIQFSFLGHTMQHSHCLNFSLKLNESGVLVAMVSPSGKKRIHQFKVLMTEETRRRSSRSVKMMFSFFCLFAYNRSVCRA